MNEKLKSRLLVPVNIEALLVGRTVQGTGWINLKPDFRALRANRILGQQLENKPFGSIVSDLHAPGVHLHWALPDGLTHGIKQGDGEIKFPLIPNRWLIVRLWDQGGPARPDLQFKAWILESDTVTTDQKATSFPRAKDDRYEFFFAGKQFTLDDWKGEVADSVDITALGYGESAFAAYYPACRTVLGFHDSDLDALKNTSLTYFVAGWYSSSSKDPLYQAQTSAAQGEILDALNSFFQVHRWTYTEFADLVKKAKDAEAAEVDLKERKEMAQRIEESLSDLEARKQAGFAGPATTGEAYGSRQKGLVELQTQITQAEAQQATLANEVKALEKNLPSEIICHGVISGILWRSKDTLYDTGVPTGTVKLSCGNTPVEALSALFQGGLLDDDLARLLEAFQFELLDELEQPGGSVAVEQEIHERCYSPRTRGLRWRLLQPEKVQHEEADEQKAPPIPGDLALLLENLNARQRTINALKRERDSLSSQLYATWYKKVLNDQLKKISAGVLEKQITDLEKEIDAVTARIAELQDQQGKPKGSEWDQIHALIPRFLPGYQLEQLEESRFWKANDPVVLLAGRPFQRSSRHGEDGRYRSDGMLLCRLSGQLIAGLKVTIPNAQKQVEFGPSDLDQWRQPFLQGKPLPEEIVDLLRECLLLTLDEKRANAIARAAYEKNQQPANDPDVRALAGALLKWAANQFRDDSFVPDLKNPPPTEDSATFVFAGDQPVIPSPVGKKQWAKNPWLPLFLQWQVAWTPTYTSVSRALENWELNEIGTEFEWKAALPNNPSQTYSATVLLTATASLSFSDRLRQYNLMQPTPSEPLVALVTAVRSMNILCQSIGGFTENLLTRKGLLELRPPIFDRVRGVDWLSPLTDQLFFPVRAGHLKVEKLRVVDAFGQMFDVDSQSLSQIYRSPQLTGPKPLLRLGPRLSQFARLTMYWPPAGQDAAKGGNGNQPQEADFNPVCGWILANFLDKSLMIYDAHGQGLGSLEAVKTKSWEQGVGGNAPEIEGFHWIGLPGTKSFFFGPPSTEDPDPLGPTANPDLRGFVRGLLSLTAQSGAAFAALLQNLNDAMSVGGGAGSVRNPNLSLLIGRPLALVRARLALELDGPPALAQGWSESAKPRQQRTGDVDSVKFPVRLGDRQKWNDVWVGDDGLIGFFQNRQYNVFYPAFGLAGRGDDYNHYSFVPQISIATPLDLTLLMDPSRGVCVTSGILPRQVFEFPYDDIASTLENKQVIFYTGPVLSPRAAADKPQIRMPQPSDIYGQWSWTHHPEVEIWREEGITDTQKEPGYFSEAPLEIAEGWLKLITAPLAIRVFTIQGKNPIPRPGEKEPAASLPAEYQISPGETIVLSWVVTGADDIELLQNGASLFKSHRQPLPAQYSLAVDGNSSFTLVATSRPDPLSETTKPRQKETMAINVRIK